VNTRLETGNSFVIGGTNQGAGPNTRPISKSINDRAESIDSIEEEEHQSTAGPSMLISQPALSTVSIDDLSGEQSKK